MVFSALAATEEEPRTPRHQPPKGDGMPTAMTLTCQEGLALQIPRQNLLELRDDLAMSAHESPLVPERPSDPQDKTFSSSALTSP